MKKCILFFLVAVCSVTGVSAQKINAGLKGGVNITNFSGSSFDDVKKSALVGYHVGGYLNFSLGGIYIQPELLLSTAGARIKDASGSDDIRITYITVPVMLKLKSKSGFYVEAGPQVGFKLSEKFGDQTIDDFTKGLDLSVGAGLGYQFNNGFGFGGRYLLGLSKLGDFDPNAGINNDFRNGVIQLGVFYRFTSGK